MTSTLHALKLFGLNNLSTESQVRALEQELNVDLGHRSRETAAQDKYYYPQFQENLRREAEEMARHYAIFYCLENYIRELISTTLKDQFGSEWWNNKVPQQVRENSKKLREREISSGVTPRSTDHIDFTTFGELGEIIKSNRDIFGDMFRDVRAAEDVLVRLNTLRGPIAHCKALAEDEVLRLELSLRDLFRLMGAA